MSTRVIRRALISVSDKTGLVELARLLHSHDVALVSTGSTAATIADAGIPVMQVSEVTGFPECFDGRVKTLHPHIHGGLLADQSNPEHRATALQLGIEGFDLLIVNLYPFTATVASGAAVGECIEQIDIGGPAMVRAAAKNHANVAVVVSPDLYGLVREAMSAGGFTHEQRRSLAAAAFAHTAAYDTAVATWMAEHDSSDTSSWPAFSGMTLRRQSTLRYGENPHQSAALYVPSGAVPSGIAGAEQLHGKEMSYNNYVDADAAWRAAHDHDDAAVAIVKHANPCGIALSRSGDIAQAYRRAHDCDPVSAFGGVIAANRTVTLAMAQQIADVFTEVVVAPDFEPGAIDVLSGKTNLRLLRVAQVPALDVEWRAISGGVLRQSADRLNASGDDADHWALVSGEPADVDTLADLVMAWRSVRAVKSNAIVLAHEGALVGVGMGQVNRVDSARLAVARAGVERAKGSVAASDAFFPFADGLQILLDAGVRAVVQPGGSVRDEEVIAAARAARVTMYLTGTRHFAH